jgi:protein-tyrosine phosphatase
MAQLQKEPPRFVDLHCHYIPGVDDGVRTQDEGLELCRALHAIGYGTIAATPHIRSVMFDNEAEDLKRRFERFAEAARGSGAMPELVLGAEHFCDDHFWRLFERGETLPYSGGKALLLELPPDRMPLGLDERCFRLQVRGLRPVLAHPERYAPLWSSSAPLERLLELGMLALLDLMSLVDKYGRKPRRAAERMLEEEIYFAACSDCHRPADVELVAAAIERLQELIGDDAAHRLLQANPAAILSGEVDR